MSPCIEARKQPHTDQASAAPSLYGMHREHPYAGALSFLRLAAGTPAVGAQRRVKTRA